MTVKSTSAPARRKSKSVAPTSTPANVVHLDSKRKKLKKYQWQTELIEFMKSLSKDETALIKRFTNLLSEQPETKRVQPQPCELIQLPSTKKHSSKVEEIKTV